MKWINWGKARVSVVSSRFDHVTYDFLSRLLQAKFKERFNCISAEVEKLPDGRSRQHAIDRLEEAYMWVGKAIRDGQLNRPKPE